MADHPGHPTQATADSADMSWACNALVKLPGVLHALLVTHDGLLLAKDSGMDRDVADPMAAGLASMKAIAENAAPFCDTQEPLKWRFAIVDLTDFTVMLFSGGRYTFVAVAVEGDYASREVGVALTETFDKIAGLRDQLAARDRQVDEIEKKTKARIS